MTNKKKVLNDPVFGFITIPSDFIFEVIEQPEFQRLRRIKQLGLTDLIYPGANHTRFHHALGALHLMQIAIENLRLKQIEITEKEAEAAFLAILLHDIGHGPFSHALEYSLLEKVPHEKISLCIIQLLNNRFEGKLSLAIEIFTDVYPKKFLHQLVSSQLDIDRLDYLSRDSYFTGVAEGIISHERILKMMSVHQNQLVIEEKGIYSVENFIHSRRLMYWQVYLHKTALAAETMLVNILRRAKYLLKSGKNIFVPESLSFFLQNQISIHRFETSEDAIFHFTQLDDYDIWFCIKSWVKEEDFVLSYLCKSLINRNLFKIFISSEQIDEAFFLEKIHENLSSFALNEEEKSYLFCKGETSNSAYIKGAESIKIMTKNGTLIDIGDASDLSYVKTFRKLVKKYYLCYSKPLYL